MKIVRLVLLALVASFAVAYQSNMVVQKPIFLKPKNLYLKDWCLDIYSIDDAYGLDGLSKTFLTYNKADTLLRNFFVENDLPSSDTTSYGQLDFFKAQAENIYNNFVISYSINDHWYIDASLAFDSWSVTKLGWNFINPQFDSQDQQNAIIKSIGLSLQQYAENYYTYTSVIPRLDVGYNYLFEDIDVVNFVHGNAQIGIQGSSSVTYKARALLHLPNALKTNSSFNIAHGIDVGVLQWLTLGSSQAVMLFVPKTVTIPFNAGAPKNNLLFTDSITGTLGVLPNIDFALYAKIGKPSWRVRGSLGYVYQHGFGASSLDGVTADDVRNIPTDVAVLLATERFSAWSLGLIFWDIDFIVLCNEEKEHELVLGLGAQHAVHGKNAFARQGGYLRLGLQWIYEF